jgi:CopG family nickel-responsive transcriptional regulator
MKSNLTRVSISLEQGLLDRFDRQAEAQGYATRSEAIKALIQSALVAQEWKDDHEVAGAIALVYDHHKGGLARRLTAIQHDFGSIIISTQHVHLSHDDCLELVVVRGRAHRIRELLAHLRAVKGLKHNSLVMTTTGRAG